MFVGDYPRVEHLKGASIIYALALSANIRHGWKNLPGTNTLAYYENPQITLVPGDNVIKLFTVISFR
jgi:hypothetical protein